MAVHEMSFHFRIDETTMEAIIRSGLRDLGLLSSGVANDSEIRLVAAYKEHQKISGEEGIWRIEIHRCHADPVDDDTEDESSGEPF